MAPSCTVARLDEPDHGKGGLVKGGVSESVLAPVWHDDTSMYLISDWPGWWNLYTAEPGRGARPRRSTPPRRRFAAPLWRLGQRPYAVLADGQLGVLYGCPASWELRHPGPLDRGTDQCGHSVPELCARAVRGRHVRCAGPPAAPSTPMSVIRVDMTTGKSDRSSIRRPGTSCPRPATCPRRASWTSKEGSARRCTPGCTRRPTQKRRPEKGSFHRMWSQGPWWPGVGGMRPQAGPGEGVLHQPGHRRDRRELRRLGRLWPGGTGSGCAASGAWSTWRM